MAICWTENLSTGLGWQDEQHKELFERLDKLYEAISRGRGKEEVESTLDFLDGYVTYHFSREDGEMKTRSYPAYDSHKAEHDRFKASIASLKEDFNAGSPALSYKVKTVLTDWLLSHIIIVDRDLGLFLFEHDG